MDTTQVYHQFPVNENPNVIVAGKLVCYSLLLTLGCMSAILLDKSCGHMDTKIMVNRRIC